MPVGPPPVKCRRASKACIPRSGAAVLAQHDAHQIGGILRAEFLHDARAMHLNGARADAEFTARLLVGRAGGDLAEYIALARGEQIVSLESFWQRLRAIELPGPARPCFDRLTYSRDHGRGIERLLEKIERAGLDCLDGHRDISA